MCDPISATVAAATLFSAVGTAAQGFSAADVARYNAKQERTASIAKESEYRIQAGRQLGEQTVALATSGANVAGDTPLLLLGESARNAELDALTIRQTGNARANAYSKQSQADQIGGVIGAGATLLGGAFKLQQLGAIKPANSNAAPMPASQAMGWP